MDENQTNVDYNKICRCCTTDKNVQNLFQEVEIEKQKYNLKEIIKYVTTIEISENDRLPHKICLKCIGNLYMSYKVKKLWLKTDENLKNHLENPVKIKEELSIDDNESTNEIKVDNLSVYCDPLFIKVEETNKNDYVNENETEVTENDTEIIENDTDIVENETASQNDQLYCQHCRIYFNTREEYTEHYKSVNHRKQNFLPCLVCGKYFVSYRLKIHMRTHTEEKPFQCEICQKRFNVRVNLSRHMKIHTGEKPHKCEICGKAFIQAPVLKDHIRTHTGERPYSCDVCGNTYKQQSQLLRHKKNHKSPDVKTEKPKRFNCNFCGQTLLNQTTYDKHLLTHGECNYSCDYCGKKFRTPASASIHRKVHMVEKPFKCSMCDKSFKFKQKLKYHMMTHTGEKRFSCEFCEKQFLYKCNLESHLSIHTGESRFKCNICGEGFMQRQKYTDHKQKCFGTIKETETKNTIETVDIKIENTM